MFAQIDPKFSEFDADMESVETVEKKVKFIYKRRRVEHFWAQNYAVKTTYFLHFLRSFNEFFSQFFSADSVSA